MSDIIDTIELDGLRADFADLLGSPLDGAKTTVAITRITDATKGPIDPDTLQYTAGSPVVIYSGEAHISPVTFRRDRQEVAGGEAQRIRQYRAILPWDSGDIHINDNLEVITSTDPQFVAHGKNLQITDVMYESELAVRRITMVDVSGAGDAC